MTLINTEKVKIGTGISLSVVPSDASSSLTIGTDMLSVTGQAAIDLTTTQQITDLSIADTAKAHLTGGSQLSMRDLTITGGGTLDVDAGEVVLHSSATTPADALAAANLLIGAGRNAATLWGGTGITSSAAKADAHRGLAAVLNTLDGAPIDPAQDGGSVLVKYTLNGDSDLNGTIDASDYFRIDRGYRGLAGGYVNGDFDYDGNIDADNFYLIDQAFMSQPLVAAAGAAAEARASKMNISPFAASAAPGTESPAAAAPPASAAAPAVREIQSILHDDGAILM